MISLLQGNLQVALAFVASSQGTMLYYYLEVIYTLLILYTYHKKREIFHTCVREKLHETNARKRPLDAVQIVIAASARITFPSNSILPVPRYK